MRDQKFFFLLVVIGKLTCDNGEEETLALSEKLPVEMGLQAKPSYDVINEGEWGDWVHLPLKS